MIYDYITNIDATDRFIYVVVIIISVLFTTRLPLSSHGIIGAVLGVVLVFYLNEKRDNAGETFLVALKKILSSDIMNPTHNTYLPFDSEILIFLDGYREYYQYNPALWNTFVKEINK